MDIDIKRIKKIIKNQECEMNHIENISNKLINLENQLLELKDTLSSQNLINENLKNEMCSINEFLKNEMSIKLNFQNLINDTHNMNIKKLEEKLNYLSFSIKNTENIEKENFKQIFYTQKKDVIMSMIKQHPKESIIYIKYILNNNLLNYKEKLNLIETIFHFQVEINEDDLINPISFMKEENKKLIKKYITSSLMNEDLPNNSSIKEINLKDIYLQIFLNLGSCHCTNLNSYKNNDNVLDYHLELINKILIFENENYIIKYKDVKITQENRENLLESIRLSLNSIYLKLKKSKEYLIMCYYCNDFVKKKLLNSSNLTKNECETIFSNIFLFEFKNMNENNLEIDLFKNRLFNVISIDILISSLCEETTIKYQKLINNMTIKNKSIKYFHYFYIFYLGSLFHITYLKNIHNDENYDIFMDIFEYRFPNINFKII